jgi:hypothetical protein
MSRTYRLPLFLVFLLVLFQLVANGRVRANDTYQTLPFAQDWSNTGLITADDDWSGVPGIIGFRGDGLTSSTGTDPQTILADDFPGVEDVNANETAPGITVGGVAEFEIANPVVALQGSATADAPYLLIHLDLTNYQNVQVTYNVRDIDDSTDNAVQQVALHYRVGTTGNFTNLPAGYVPDATTGPNLATLVTPVTVTLPAAVHDQPQVQLRVMTTNAVGPDEWVGIDDLAITGTPIGDFAPGITLVAPANGAARQRVNVPVTVTFSEEVAIAGTVQIACTISGTQDIIPFTGDNETFTLPHTNFSDGDTCTVTVTAAQVTDLDTDDPPDNMATDYSWNFSVGGVIINEFLADPAGSMPGDLQGDANGDGIRDATDDEFVEIINNTGVLLDISGWTLSDRDGVTHTFPAGTVVPDGCAIIVFGGGTPTGTFGNAQVQIASTGTLSLNNAGDDIFLNDGSVNRDSLTYTSAEGNSNQSHTRDPDVAGSSFVEHSTAVGSGNAPFSPGTQVNDSYFPGCSECGNPATLIHDIQGNGLASPLEGQVHTIEGIVVGDFQTETTIRGFYLQEEDIDIDVDPATSEGIFVYDNYASPGSSNVNIGQRVRVNGTVAEFSNLTELNNVTEVEVCSTTAVATPATITLPFPDSTYLERFEGMAVTLPQTLTVSENYFLGRFGEVVLSNGRLHIPTNVVSPGAPAQAMLAANLLNYLILDDGRLAQNPDPIIHPAPELTAANTLRSGDTAGGVTGILSQSWSGFPGTDNYRLHPTAPPAFVASNARTAGPAPVNGTSRVASFNLLNYFNGDGLGGGFPTSRGADDLFEFTRQRDKIIPALIALDADVIGLMELENDGYGPNSAIADLVNGLNAVAGPGTYAFVDPLLPALGSDEIAVGIIYKPGMVTLDSFATDGTGAFAARNRQPLAATFSEISSGETFTVVVNHFKSKGSDCDDGTVEDPDNVFPDDPDTGDGQGNCNLTRRIAAEQLLTWLATDPTGSGDPDFLIIGDLNSYALEDPITLLESNGFTNLTGAFEAGDYSYVFAAQAGQLDYALSNLSLLVQVTGATTWHSNADEPAVLDYNTEFKTPGQIISLYNADPYRASDHDPVLIGLELGAVSDLSDLDSSYGLAWHVGDGALRLGTAWDADTTHNPGDDDDTDDGVLRGPGSGPGGQWQPGVDGGSLDVTVTGSGNGCLYGWIDWNGDGRFNPSEAPDNLEYIIRGQTTGSGNYAFEVPANEFDPPPGPPTPIQAYNVRVRLYESCSSGPTGGGVGGEVEDYEYEFSPTAVTLQSFRIESSPVLGWLVAGCWLLVGIWYGRRRFRQR